MRNKFERRLLGLKRVYRMRHGFPLTYPFSERQAGRYLHTRKPCSCPWCGNPRHHWGKLTPQEIRASDEMREEILSTVVSSNG